MGDGRWASGVSSTVNRESNREPQHSLPTSENSALHKG